jgi:hypothetical protein
VGDPRRYVCEREGHPYTAADLSPGELRCAIDRSRLVPEDESLPAATPARTQRAAVPDTNGATASAAGSPPPSFRRGGSLRPAHSVRLEFGATVVDVSRGEEVLLGRDPEYSPQHAEFFGTYPTVSRRHAILRMDDDGRAWIRDCYSSNLTRVNGEPLAAGEERELRTSDQVRLCAQLSGNVTLIREVPDVA